MTAPTDTIAAAATPAGQAALAVVRISGPDTERLATALLGRSPTPRRAVHAVYRSVAGKTVDDVVLTFFRGPQSYTGEDGMEISTHGNPFIVQTVLEDLWARGCRPAGPGEFTQRAFLNGRMDLSQAEAVMDVIHARSERALAAAQAQLGGALGRRMEDLVERVLGILARVEAYIDFPDEDLPAEDKNLIRSELSDTLSSIESLAATSHYGEMLRDGVKTVLLGAPNAGKSSLLNALVGRNRALVSPEPGTTRDFIEERLVVGPHCLRLIDTAGLNASPAPLERLGIEKTLERVAEADLILVVLDASQPGAGGGFNGSELPAAVRERLQSKNTLVVWNKIDLPRKATPSPALPADLGVWEVSALTGAGVEALRAAIVARADGFAGSDQEGVAINARHFQALQEAKSGVRAALEKLERAAPAELLASDLRLALAGLESIMGRIDNERMLDRLFATFCIGK